MNDVWTDKEVAFLKECISKKMTTDAAALLISETFHREVSRSSCGAKAARLGLKFSGTATHIKKTQKKSPIPKKETVETIEDTPNRTSFGIKEFRIQDNTFNRAAPKLIADINKAHKSEDPKQALDLLFGPRMPITVVQDRPRSRCSWIYGDATDVTSTFCGRLRIHDVTGEYCDYHRIISSHRFLAKIIKTANKLPLEITGLSRIRAFVDTDGIDSELEEKAA